MTKKLSPEKRKKQIIETALKLFKEKGHENTSIRDILDEVGISKGGFYHYFNSKEDLLEEISKMIVEKIMEIPREIAVRDDLTALEKLNTYICRVNLFKVDQSEEIMLVFKKIYSGEKNLKLEQKILQYVKESMFPIIKSIIDQGIKEGDFNVHFPEETAKLYVNLIFTYFREIGPLFTKALENKDKDKMEKVKKKSKFLQIVIEKIFGLKEDSLVIEEVAQKTIRKLWSEYGNDIN